MLISIVSIIATITSVLSLVPQMIKSYRTKSCHDISMVMLINFIICSMSWIVYGILENAQTVWLTNIFMLICASVMIYMKLIYDKK